MNTNSKYGASTKKDIQDQTREILNEYLLSLEFAGKGSSISKSRLVLENFFTECMIPIEELLPDDVLKWFQEFSIGKKERIMTLALSTLSAFFKFCVDESYLDKQIVKDEWRPKKSNPLQQYLNEHEYARVKRAVEQLTLQNQILVLFQLSSGCRIHEITELTIQDIDLDKRIATVKGKSGARTVHFSLECAHLLRDYLRKRSGEPTEPLFVSKSKEAIAPNIVGHVTRAVGRMAGLERELHSQSLRHTYVKNRLASGASLVSTTEEMGHRDLNLIRRYVGSAAEKMS